MRLILSIFVPVLSCFSAFGSMHDGFQSDSDSIVIRPRLRIVNTSNNTSLFPTIPTSPQAAAFQRVGDYSVHNASGIPDISIPLYEIKHHGYTIPIGIRYIATPLRPGYNYDVTGIGWSLTFGSCISRTIESAPDEDFNFRLSTDKLNDCYLDRPNGISEELSKYNWQHDKFSVTLPDGRSFHFFICNDEYHGLHYAVSDKRFKISNDSDLSSFTIVDESGIIYYFDVTDYCTDGYYGKKVAWYLSKIKLPNTPIPIYFSYDKRIVHDHLTGYDEPIINLCHQFYCMPDQYHNSRVTVGCTFSDPVHSYRTMLITGIYCGRMNVTFNYKYTPTESTHNYLTNINISDMSQSERNFNFEYKKSDLMGMPVVQLTRLVIKGAINSADSLVYLMNNYSISGFCGTDLWGNWSDNYYKTNVGNMNFYAEFDTTENAALASTHLLRFVQKETGDHCPYQKINLIGRSSYNMPRRALDPSAYGILRSITYPTGGRTEFEFENHRFVTATAANGDYVATKKKRRVIEGGGFRIARIKNYSADGKIVNIKSFRYGPTFREVNSYHMNLPADPTNHSDQHIGYGEPVVDPNILTFAHFTSSGNLPTQLQYMLLGQDSNGQYGSFVNPFQNIHYASIDWRWDCHFSPLFFQSLLGGRNAVVYPEITEYEGDIGDMDNHKENTIGKTIYRFDIYDTQGDSSYYMRLSYYDNILYVDQSQYVKDYLTRREHYKNIYGIYMIDNTEKYTYNSEGAGTSEYLLAERYSPGYYPNTLYVYNLLAYRYRSVSRVFLSSKYNYQYNTQGTFTTSEVLEYNGFGVLKKKVESGSKTRTTNITCPDPSDTLSVINKKLVSKHMMSSVLESHTGVSAMVPMDAEGFKIDYIDTLGMILPAKIYQLNIVDGRKTGYEQEQQVLTYSNAGNPLEVIDRGGMHTVYLWGYGNRFLIAEIKNATLSEVSSAVTSVFGTTINSLSGTAPNISSLASLRNHTLLANAMVTTWTYDPLAGITSETGPSGLTKFYEYDDIGRLTEILQYEGNVISPSNKRILKQYSYHSITR